MIGTKGGAVPMDYFMGDDAPFGALLYWWKADGKLHTGCHHNEMPIVIGLAGHHLERGRIVRVVVGKVCHLIYNPCGDLHLGRCCINGLRSDGTRGLTCTHCGDAITQEQRDQISDSFAQVAQLKKLAGCN